VDGLPLEDIHDPLVGTVIAGRYELEEVLGEGGMATVYRAHHRLVNRPCAVKVMKPRYATHDVVRERFRREAKAAQKLAHPNIIEIFEQGETDEGCLYLVMELLDGHSLADELERGKVPLERSLPILIQVARALARAHDLEVLHRDLKPENVFLAEQPDGHERVVLLDFGIARSNEDVRLTESGEVFGTPQYMAPERITTIDAGPSADLYAVGVMMFEMLTGRLPFEATHAAGFFVAHLNEEPPLLRSRDVSLPASAERLVSDLLAKDPADRPVDAHRLHADLVEIAQEVGAHIPSEPGSGAESSAPAVALPPADVDRWRRRVAIFGRMLGALPTGGRTKTLIAMLDKIKGRVREIAELRRSGLERQQQLEEVEVRGREGRLRFGHAVDALGIDASRARDEAKQAAAMMNEVAADGERCRQRVLELHRDLIFWEGRSGFVDPYPELAAALRALAEEVDAWAEARERLLEAQDRVNTERNDVADLEFQIQELRTALASFQQGIEAEQAKLQEAIREMGTEAARLETELLELATGFCSPLRSKTELLPLFREL
jgi:serine/threonine-protein kinase